MILKSPIIPDYSYSESLILQFLTNLTVMLLGSRTVVAWSVNKDTNTRYVTTIIVEVWLHLDFWRG